MANAGKEAANLTVAAFVQDDDQVRAVALFLLDRDRVSAGKTFGQMNAFFQPSELSLVRRTGDPHQIRLFNAVARMRDAVGEFAVIGDENKSFAGAIESADS